MKSMRSILPLQLAVLPVSCSFLKSFLVSNLYPEIPYYTILYSITFKNVQNFQQNSIFVAESHFYIKPLTSSHCLLPSNALSVFK